MPVWRWSSQRLGVALAFALKLAGERFAVDQGAAALERRRLSIFGGEPAIVCRQRPVLRRLRAPRHRSLECTRGADDAFGTAARLVVVVLCVGVVLRHHMLARVGGHISCHRGDVAIVGDHVPLLGGIQACPRAVVARGRAALARVGRVLTARESRHVAFRRGRAMLGERPARTDGSVLFLERPGHVSSGRSSNGPATAASQRLDGESR